MIATVICPVCREEIGRIDTETIHTPMDGSMFLSPDPEHGAEPPFPGGADVDWPLFYCPYGHHRPFPAEDEVLTREIGIYRVPPKSIPIPVEQDQGKPEIERKKRGRPARQQQELV